MLESVRAGGPRLSRPAACHRMSRSPARPHGCHPRRSPCGHLARQRMFACCSQRMHSGSGWLPAGCGWSSAMLTSWSNPHAPAELAMHAHHLCYSAHCRFHHNQLWPACTAWSFIVIIPAPQGSCVPCSHTTERVLRNTSEASGPSKMHPWLAHSALLPVAPVVVWERLLRGRRHHRQEILHFQHSFLPVAGTPVSTFSMLAANSCLPQCVRLQD